MITFLLLHHLLQVVGREDSIVRDVMLVDIQKLLLFLQVTALEAIIGVHMRLCGNWHRSHSII